MFHIIFINIYYIVIYITSLRYVILVAQDRVLRFTKISHKIQDFDCIQCLLEYICFFNFIVVKQEILICVIIRNIAVSYKKYYAKFTSVIIRITCYILKWLLNVRLDWTTLCTSSTTSFSVTNSQDYEIKINYLWLIHIMEYGRL